MLSECRVYEVKVFEAWCKLNMLEVVCDLISHRSCLDA
jgi:hypothetical protein